jgi:hypothetical protein
MGDGREVGEGARGWEATNPLASHTRHQWTSCLGHCRRRSRRSRRWANLSPRQRPTGGNQRHQRLPTRSWRRRRHMSVVCMPPRLSSLGLPPRLCRAAGGACRHQLPFLASSAARNASGTRELVLPAIAMQLSMAQLATHTRAAKVQHTGFQCRQYLCFRDKYRNLVCNSVLCPKKSARIGCCLRWTCLL